MTHSDVEPVKSPEEGSRPQSRKERRAAKAEGKKSLPLWQESILLVGVAVALAIIIKAFVLQAFYIPSGSMEPGLVQNDRILVQKWSYWGSKEPERGDVVVFKDPGDWLGPEGAAGGPSGNVQKLLEKVGLYPSGGHLVKRVIGVGGDTIKCCDSNGLISVNGTPLDEPYLSNAGECNGPMIPSCRWTAGPIPEDNLFVMGDHRDMSGDSSAHLCLPKETDCVPGDEYVATDLVVGKAFVLIYPRDHFDWIERPATFSDVASAP